MYICVTYCRSAVLWSWSHLFLQDSQACRHTLCPLVYILSSLGIPTHQGNSLESYYLKIQRNTCDYIMN